MSGVNKRKCCCTVCPRCSSPDDDHYTITFVDLEWCLTCVDLAAAGSSGSLILTTIPSDATFCLTRTGRGSTAEKCEWKYVESPATTIQGTQSSGGNTTCSAFFSTLLAIFQITLQRVTSTTASISFTPTIGSGAGTVFLPVFGSQTLTGLTTPCLPTMWTNTLTTKCEAISSPQKQVTLAANGYAVITPGC